MFDDFLKLVSRLREKNEPFAVATVVRCERPTSAKPGDRALISRDGKLSGWVGGGCAQPIVIKEAMKALEDGNPRFVRVSPTVGAEPSDGITGYTMMCHSGGTLDIFIEPILSKVQLLIFGRSAVAQTLATLAKTLSYRVAVVAPEESREDFADVDIFQQSGHGVGLMRAFEERSSTRSAIVVATQGEDDEGALEQALSLDAAYVAFVASKKKWEAVSEYLQGRGFSSSQLKHVKVPAGLDIKAAAPGEIAVSILAEIIQVTRSAAAHASPETAKHRANEPAEQEDPICRMMVNVATAKHISKLNGRTFYFCSAHCKSTFEKDPEQYIKMKHR
ncbi:MAG: XdhC family protein [Ignavibacteriales bacterium]|nr:XdhC family protein [Ignavibacteriales bacterium]